MKNETSSGQECSCIPSRWKVGVWGRGWGWGGAGLSSEVERKSQRGVKWSGGGLGRGDSGGAAPTHKAQCGEKKYTVLNRELITVCDSSSPLNNNNSQSW